MEDISNNKIIDKNNETNKLPINGSMGGPFGLIIAMINNPIYADIKDNKITNIYNFNETVKINDDNIKKMKNIFDTDGFLKLSININNLFNIYNETLKNINLFNDNYKISQDIKITSGKIILDFCSTIGLFILTKETDENINKNIITILIPKILFTERYAEFINLIFDGIIIEKINTLIPSKEQNNIFINKINMVRKILLKFFEEFNKSSNNNEIKFANMMNFLVNLLVVFFIIVIFTFLGVPIGNIFAEAFNMFSHLLAQFPNDTCYFKNNILLFEPNICEKKIKAINNEKKEKPIRHIKILSGAIFVSVLIIIYLLIKINKMKKNEK
jgi:hypothetical protein